MSKKNNRFVKLALERLEDRITPNTYDFIPTTGGDNTYWFNPNNWYDFSTGQWDGLPGAADTAYILGNTNVVINSGFTAYIGNLSTDPTSTLTIPGITGAQHNSTLNVAINGDFSGTTYDQGQIITNGSGQVKFEGYAYFGPGVGQSAVPDGNLAGTGTFNMAAYNPNGLPIDEFFAGATIGSTTGGPIIQMGDTASNTPANVQIDGPLTNYNCAISLDGHLKGSGSLDNYGTVVWQNGIIDVNVTNESTAIFSGLPLAGAIDGSYELTQALSNKGGTMRFLGLNTPFVLTTANASVDNNSGGTTLIVSTHFIDAVGNTHGLINNTGSTMTFGVDFNGGGNLIGCAFDNEGTLVVKPDGSGPCVFVGSAEVVALNGTLQIQGTLSIACRALTNGAINQDFGGTLVLGGPSFFIAANSTFSNQGKVNMVGLCELTGAGEFYNNGILNMQFGVTTLGLGSFVQSNAGTLTLGYDPISDLTDFIFANYVDIDGTLQLSDTPVKTHIYMVVSANTLKGTFAKLPPNMTQNVVGNTIKVTQN